MTNPKIVFFDFDGVVLDSAKIKTLAFPEVFKDYPQHLEAITNYHLENQGISRYEKFDWIYQTLLKTELSNSEKEELGNTFSEIVLEKVMQCPFIKGAKNLLEYFRETNIKCVVASGTPYKELHTIIKKRNLSQFFIEVWGSPKHKEAIIEDILERYSIEPSEALFLGDATTDYFAAKSNNVPFQAVYSDEMIDFWENENIKSINDLEQIKSLYFSN
ncbi:MAG: HAD hydrolase-like protein [Bacteroidia bacterium]|nr:HAD hydrolase-like protein [Bacteroidia bacterium]